ncbi:diguanylate cyclase [Rhodopirellula maiorica SM1]|uniref:diguanylate cyclase n=1 Tax=Rhodopirellula maiorica SM1 TaxID=1265738 RepID=M5RMR7_9BACT|nr:GGDEF domain-containing protein [Rhodopirellula maiorica]EMI20600.1 diguanylate cyclase [Rhodopirellula maiorica SM1]
MTSEPSASDADQDFDHAFSIAKKALQFVGRFRTPPTPTIYEVWYRYSEGASPEIREQLSGAIDNAKPVSIEQLEALHQQYCQPTHVELNSQISSKLEDELQELVVAIDRQMHAGEKLGHSIDHANRDLTSANITPEKIKACVAEVLASNATMQSQLDSMKVQLKQSQGQINHLQEELIASQRSTMTDALTGVGNRRCFDALMETAIRSRCSDTAGDAVLILVDLDGFKQVNDHLGHTVGDSLLKFIAAKIQSVIGDATVARYGGDEFGVFMRVAMASEALQFAEKIRDSLANHRFKHQASGQSLPQITASIGVAILRSDDSRKSWFDRADKLLYCAKENGRNCIRAERQLNRVPSINGDA